MDKARSRLSSKGIVKNDLSAYCFNTSCDLQLIHGIDQQECRLYRFSDCEYAIEHLVKSLLEQSLHHYH